MREKKSMKKIKQDDVVQSFEQRNAAAGRAERAAALPDADLFTVNVNKDGLQKKREKLAADRFKEKEGGHWKSKTEQAILKKLALKKPPQKQNIKPVDPYADIWATGDGPSNKVQKFKNFTNRSLTKVKAVVAPMGGQSFNPSAKSHRGVLEQVLQEEEKDIEAEYRGSLAHILNAAAAAEAPKDKESEESESVDSDAPEGVNPAVDRRKKLTKSQRNKKVVGKANRDFQEQMKQQKKAARQYDNIGVLIGEDAKATKKEEERIRKRQEETIHEKRRQEDEGVVSKPVNTGRFKYKMRKTDF